MSSRNSVASIVTACLLAVELLAEAFGRADLAFAGAGAVAATAGLRPRPIFLASSRRRSV